MNRYQLSKARKIARYLVECAQKTNLPTTSFELSRLVRKFSEEEWRTVSFAAGVAVADLPAKSAVLDILKERAPHVIGGRSKA